MPRALYVSPGTTEVGCSDETWVELNSLLSVGSDPYMD